MQDSIVIRRANTLRLSDLARFHSDLHGLAPQGPAADELFRGVGSAALAGSDIVGLTMGSPFADNGRAERQLFFLDCTVRPAWRKRGIGGQLIGAIIEECRSEHSGATVIMLVDEEADAPMSRLLQRHGFRREAEMLRYERTLAEVPVRDTRAPFDIFLYRGGDPATDTALVDLYTRGYQHRRAVPRLTEAGLREQLSRPNFACLIATEAGRLVGHGTGFRHASEYLMDSILVARSHWGSGTADALLQASFRHARDQGCTRYVGNIEATNAASRELARRNGLAVTGRLQRFLLEL